MAPAAQMVWDGPELPPVKHNIEDLNPPDIDEMLALVELTKPGPFSRRTPELDHTSEFTKRANLWLWRGNDSDSQDTLRSALSAPVPKTGAADTPVPLSLFSFGRSRREVRLLSSTSARKMLKPYASMRN